MGVLYTALSVTQYAELLNTKNVPLGEFSNDFGLEFTEDKAHWHDRIKNQEDLESVIDYQYSIIIEFETDTKTINSIIGDSKTGRLSEKVVNYYQQLEKPVELPVLSEQDVNVLCIMDIYESQETTDGISQLWKLLVNSAENELWCLFTESVHKISCLGAIPGAVEEAKKIVMS